MAVQIDQLFNQRRFKDFTPTLFLLFMVYFPVGVCLMLLRILMSFQYILVLAILPKHWLVRKLLLKVYLFLMGILITSEGENPCNANIVISNYISYFDSIAIEAVIATRRLYQNAEIPSWLNWSLGFKSDDNLAEEATESHCSFPFSFFPEEGTTNGRCGLLKFSKSIFQQCGLVVQPIVITTTRSCFFPIHIHYLFSSFWSDVLWTLFFPCTKFHISCLQRREIPNEDGLEEFIKELENDMASSLSIETTSYTLQDKKEYVKRLEHEEKMKQLPARMPQLSQSEPTKKIKQMVNQVKFVLPQVPLHIIEKEVSKTKNVDVVISNFLDGSVKYTPLTEKEQDEEKEIINSKKETVAKKANISTIANLKSKDRHLSFQDKKKLMIEEARSKYLQLHPEFL